MCILFSLSAADAQDSLLGYKGQKVNEVTISENGLSLTTDTVIRATTIKLNGEVITNGHQLLLDTNSLVIGGKGKITGFKEPAPSQVLIPAAISTVPGKAGRDDIHGRTGDRGYKGKEGYEGIAGRQDSKSIQVIANNIEGQLTINGNGQTGGRGGKGGKGGRGGDGGNGLNGDVEAVWGGLGGSKGRPGGNAGRGGAPGHGGNGGQGGKGGNNIEVILKTSDTNIQKTQITSEKGEGGSGGEVGDYGDPGQPGSPGSDSSTRTFWGEKISVPGGSGSTPGVVDESPAQKNKRVGAKGKLSSIGKTSLTKLPIDEIEQLKKTLEKNIINFHIQRLFYKSKLELFSYLVGRVEFNLDEMDEEGKLELLSSFDLMDLSLVTEMNSFLKEKLLVEIQGQENRGLRSFQNEVQLISKILDQIQQHKIENAHTMVKDMLDDAEKYLLMNVDDLALECYDYNQIIVEQFPEVIPQFIKTPTCQKNGLTSLRNDFFAELILNEPYKPTVFPSSIIEQLDIKSDTGVNVILDRLPSNETIIDTIVINNKKLKRRNFQEALNIKNESEIVTSYEVNKKGTLDLSKIITNLKIIYAALGVLNE